MALSAWVWVFWVAAAPASDLAHALEDAQTAVQMADGVCKSHVLPELLAVQQLVQQPSPSALEKAVERLRATRWKARNVCPQGIYAHIVAAANIVVAAQGAAVHEPGEQARPALGQLERPAGPAKAMAAASFATLMKRLVSAKSDSQRLVTLQKSATESFFTVEQMAQLLKLLASDEQRIALLRHWAARVVDPERAPAVVSTFSDPDQGILALEIIALLES